MGVSSYWEWTDVGRRSIFRKPAKARSISRVPEDLGTFFLRRLGFEFLMSYTGLLQYQINIGRQSSWVHIDSLSSRLMKSIYRLVWYSVHETDGMSQLNDQIPVLANSCNMYHRHRCTIKCVLWTIWELLLSIDHTQPVKVQYQMSNSIIMMILDCTLKYSF